MKQQFIVTIPILRDELLKCVPYVYDGYPERGKIESRFPAIPMLRHNINKDAEEISIVILITQAGNYESNLKRFYEELDILSQEIGVDLKEKVTEIEIPYRETGDKHVSFFVKLGNAIMPEAQLYMDLTYGSKVSPITEFAILTYAEHAKKCQIQEVVYGKVMESETPTIYDIKNLYRMSQLINTMSYMPNADLEKLLNSFDKKS